MVSKPLKTDVNEEAPKNHQLSQEVPTKSCIWKGPIIMPRFVFITSSIYCGSTPWATSFSAWNLHNFFYLTSKHCCALQCTSTNWEWHIRFPQNPGAFPTITGTFLIRLVISTTTLKESLSVFWPWMISTRVLIWAGLKKCIPTTCCGLLVASAIYFRKLAWNTKRHAKNRLCIYFIYVQCGCICANNCSRLKWKK